MQVVNNFIENFNNGSEYFPFLFLLLYDILRVLCFFVVHFIVYVCIALLPLGVNKDNNNKIHEHFKVDRYVTYLTRPTVLKFSWYL